MIRFSTPFKFITLVFVSAFVFIVQQAISNGAGAPTGKTGAPGEVNCTSCHTGTAVSNSSSVLVFTNMANGQYIPDSTYRIKIRILKSGCVKFGFSSTVLNSNATPSKLGALQVPSGSTDIQLSTGTRDYMTHTSSGTAAIYTDSTEWVFNWKAPSALSGDARLYIAAAATNNDGVETGDEIHLRDFTFPQTTNVPVASITTNVNTSCSGDSIYFQGSGTNGTSSYEWTFPGGVPSSSSAQNLWVKFSASGNKVCSLRVSNNIMSSAYVTKTVTILTSPSANISYNSTITLCEGDSISLGTSPNASYTFQWQRYNINISGATGAQYYARISGNYTVIVTNNIGCSTASSPVSLVFNVKPIALLIAASGITTTCEGDSILLKTGSGANYSYYWYKDNVLQSQTLDSTYYVYQGGDYSVKIFSALGCNDLSNQLSITFFNKPSGTIASQTDSICDGDFLRLSAFTLDTIASYQWYKDSAVIPGATQQEYFVGAAGSYMVDLISNRGCITTLAAKQVKVNQLPPANFIDSAKNGCSYLLQVRNPGSYSYQWLRDGSLFAINTSDVTVTQSGTYDVIITNASGCSVTTNSLVITIPAPVANFIDSVKVGCAYTLKLRDNGAFNWQWQRDGITFNATDTMITATQSGTYSMIITNALGCSITTNSITLNIPTTLPDATITPPGNAVLCSDSSITYRVPSATGSTYRWYRNATIINGATQNSLSISDSGNYYVAVDNGFCILTSATRNVKVNPTPDASVSTGDSSFCTGDSSVLVTTTVTGASYQWNKNNLPLLNANANTYIAKSSGSYNVKVILGSCSKSSNAIIVTENSLPGVPTITRNVNTLTSSTANSYQWIKDGSTISGATQQAYTITANGNYSVQITGSNGCKNSSAPISVTFTGINASKFTNIITAYPNPVYHNLNLIFAEDVLREIIVSDASGRVLKAFKEDGSKSVIDLSEIEAGVYFVKISSGMTTEILRVVKK